MGAWPCPGQVQTQPTHIVQTAWCLKLDDGCVYPGQTDVLCMQRKCIQQTAFQCIHWEMGAAWKSRAESRRTQDSSLFEPWLLCWEAEDTRRVLSTVPPKRNSFIISLSHSQASGESRTVVTCPWLVLVVILSSEPHAVRARHEGAHPEWTRGWIGWLGRERLDQCSFPVKILLELRGN